MAGEQELARLNDQLEKTRVVYDSAKLEHSRAVERMNDLSATHPDGSIRHATAVFAQALRNYRIALDEYNRFLLDNMSPRLNQPK